MSILLQDGVESKLSKYKIQPGTNAPLSTNRFLQLISLVSFNQLIVGGVAQGGDSIACSNRFLDHFWHIYCSRHVV